MVSIKGATATDKAIARIRNASGLHAPSLGGICEEAGDDDDEKGRGDGDERQQLEPLLLVELAEALQQMHHSAYIELQNMACIWKQAKRGK